MLLAVFDHQNLAVAFDYLSLDFADFFVEQYFMRQLAVNYLLANLRNALWAIGIGRPRPAKRWFRSDKTSTEVSQTTWA
jgi:hypothetical protein